MGVARRMSGGAQIVMVPVSVPQEFIDPAIVAAYFIEPLIYDMFCALALEHIARWGIIGERRAGDLGEVVVVPSSWVSVPSKFMDLIIADCIIGAALEEHMLSGSMDAGIIGVDKRPDPLCPASWLVKLLKCQGIVNLP